MDDLLIVVTLHKHMENRTAECILSDPGVPKRARICREQVGKIRNPLNFIKQAA